jgi:hypothetical protein
MASYTVSRAKHATLSGTTADLITFDGGAGTGRYTLRVTNRHSSNVLYFVFNTATVPTAAGDDTHFVPASGSVTLRARGEVLSVRVVGNGNDYSVEIA